jgi:hypothetical protein
MYYSESIINGGAEKIGEYNFVEYSVKTKDGKTLYQIIDKVDYDIPYSKLEIFGNGNSVLISSFYGILTFFSNDGAKRRIVKTNSNIKVEYERRILSFVDNMNLLVLFQDLNEEHSTIQKYDADGALEMEIQIPVVNISGIAFSEKSNKIFVSHFNWKDSGELEKRVSLFNIGGELLKRFNSTFEKGIFTNDNQFVGYSNKSVFVFNALNNNLQFNMEYDKTQVVLDVSYIEDKIIIALSDLPKLENGNWYYKNVTMLKLNSSGDVLSKENYTTTLFVDYKFERNDTSIKFITESKSIMIE